MCVYVLCVCVCVVYLCVCVCVRARAGVRVSQALWASTLLASMQAKSCRLKISKVSLLQDLLYTITVKLTSEKTY